MPGNRSESTNDVEIKFGELHVSDYFVLLFVVLRILVWELPTFLVTYSFVYKGKHKRDFKTNIIMFLIRTQTYLCNVRCTRAITGPPERYTEPVLSSRRFQPYRQNLYQKVVRPLFTGFWVLQGSVVSAQPPRESDIVILYLHSGGYVYNHPGLYFLFLLRLGEFLIEQGFKASIFALDFRLAPEYRFPTQFEEVVAAYDYLINEMQIPADKVVFAGDSAGGHLAISLLVHLQKPFTGSSNEVFSIKLPKPGGLLVMSPSISIFSSPASFKTNAHLDLAKGAWLHTTMRNFTDPAEISKPENSPYLEFLSPNPPIDWDVVLPRWTLLTSGQFEVLHDDHVRWGTEMMERVGRDRVECYFAEGQVHMFQWLETTLDEEAKKEYLAGGGETCYKKIEKLAFDIGKRLKKSNT